jgi:uncharacterized protein
MQSAYGYFCLFLILGLVSCHKSHKPNANIAPKFVTDEPVFVKQGILNFLTPEKKQISTIDIEIAETEASHEKGLMFRKHMQYNQGMLFVFEDESRRTFWMKDTDLSLDIIFINSDKMIIHVVPNCVPYSTESIPSFEYAQYVVEVNAGFCKQNGIEVGGYIDFTRE